MNVKKFPFNIFKALALILVLFLAMAITLPIDLFNLEQANRIAKWKSTYDNLKYSFSLVNLHEGKIIPNRYEAGRLVDEKYIIERLSPYLNLESEDVITLPKYKYKKKNGRRITKKSQFYFDRFLKRKDGTIIGIKANPMQQFSNNMPLYYMFIDINGEKKPNMIGKDIYFVGIYQKEIHALGSGKTHHQLKVNCSPVLGGFYCSEYYLLGGNF